MNTIWSVACSNKYDYNTICQKILYNHNWTALLITSFVESSSTPQPSTASLVTDNDNRMVVTWVVIIEYVEHLLQKAHFVMRVSNAILCNYAGYQLADGI